MARDFDGTDDHIDFGSDASIDNFVQRTFALWLSRDANGFEVLISKGDAENGMYINDVSPNGYARMYAAWSTASPDPDWRGSTDMGTTAFYHIVGTYDGSSTSNDVQLYVNSVAESMSRDFTPSGVLDADAAQVLRIGEAIGAYGDLNGRIGWFCYANAVWTAAQVNRARWWGWPGGAIAVYHPLVTTDLNNKGTATANGTATNTTMANIPRVERCWGSMMGVGR